MLIAFCLFGMASFGQETAPIHPNTEYAPCLDGQVGVKHYESSVLVSPDGQWRAYASVEADPGGKLGCSNTSTLQVQSPNDRTFQTVHTIKPEPQFEQNGMKPISWSPRGHRLAAEVSAWSNGGTDFFPRWLLVYDADRNRTIEPDLGKLFAQRYTKKECAFDIEDVLGFDSRNRVLFSADDVVDPGDDEPVPQTRCLGAPSVWALDVDNNQLELVKYSQPRLEPQP